MPKQRAQRKNENYDQKENDCGRKSRKRSVLGDHNPQPQPLRERNQQTEQLFEDMGIQYISQVGLDTCTILPKQITPAVWSTDGSQDEATCSHLLKVPGAPRLLINTQTNQITTEQHRLLEDSTAVTPTQKKYVSLDVPSRHHSAEPDSKGFDCFSTLSDEIVLSVFHWLPRFVLAKCARVCKRWSRLVQDDSLWKRIDLANKTLSQGVLGCVLKRGVWALRLAKSEIEGPCINMTGIRLSKLQYLDLSMAGVTTDVLEPLFNVCTDLRKLSLENLEITETICRCIAKNRELETLNMAMCQGITLDGLMAIVTNCERLEALHLGWTSLSKQSVVVLCLCLPENLLKLNLSGCRDNLTDEDVQHLCETSPNLRELDLSDSTSLSCQSVIHIANTLKNLEYLALSRCYHIVPSTIPQLRFLHRLVAVDVFGMLREGPLDQLKESMPNIDINNFPFSSIARPTTGIRRTSIWGIRVRETFV